MIFWALLLLIWINVIRATHFNGGTIYWAPVYPSSNSSSVLITITQSYSWTSPPENCTTNIPRSSGSSVNLVCVGSCATQNGFSNTSVSIVTDCVSFSASMGLVYSQRSINITLNTSTYFWIGYRGSAWRTLQNGGASAAWSIVSLINLIRRPDGLINTPPVAQISSPQYVIANRTTTIVLPVTDVNAGDDLRCRWSQQNSTYKVNECAATCTNVNITKLANLTGCTLTFTGTIAGVWYALALQVEDFINTTSTSPMSSVPVQFLVYVLPTPSCTQAPVIIPLTGCLEVQVNVPINFTIYIMNYCNKTIATVKSFIPTVTISGMNVSDLINSTTNTSLVYSKLSWTPQLSQIGSQEFCAVAYTSENVQSTPYCVTFNVTTSIPCTTTTTMTTTAITTEIASTITTEMIATTEAAISTKGSPPNPTSEMIIATSEAISTTITAASISTTTMTVNTTIAASIPTESATTAASNSSQTNIPLAAGLGLLGLLLLLGCSSFCLYYLIRRRLSRNRQRTEKKKNLQEQIRVLSGKEREPTIESIALGSQNTSNDATSTTEESMPSFSSNAPLLPDPTSAVEQKRINSSNITHIDRAKTPSKDDKAAIELQTKEVTNENIELVQISPKTKSFPTATPTIAKASTITETSKDKKFKKLTTRQQDNQIHRTPTKTHFATLTNNKIAASSDAPTNTNAKTDTPENSSQSNTNNLNSKTTAVEQSAPKKSSSTIFRIFSSSKQNKISTENTNQKHMVQLETPPPQRATVKDNPDVQKQETTVRRTFFKTIQRADNRLKPSVNDAMSSTKTKVDNKSIKPIVNHDAADNSTKISPHDVTSHVDNGVSSTSIEEHTSTSKSFINHSIDADSIENVDNENKSFVKDTKASIKSKSNNKRKKTIINDGISKTTSIITQHYIQLPAANRLSPTSSAIDNSISKSSINRLITDNAIRTLVSDTNPHMHDEISETDTRADAHTGEQIAKDNLITSTIEEVDNENKPSLNDAAFSTNTQVINKTNRSAVNDRSTHNIGKVADTDLQSLLSNTVSSANIFLNKTKSKSFVNESTTNSKIQLSGDKSNQLNYTGIAAANIKPNNKRSKSFVTDGLVYTSTKLSDSTNNQLIRNGASASNIKALNTRSKSFANDGITAETIKSLDNQDNPLVDHEVLATNTEVDNNDALVTSPDNALLNDPVSATPSKVDRNKINCFASNRATISTRQVTDSDVVSIRGNRLSPTNSEERSTRSNSIVSDASSVGDAIDIPENEPNLLHHDGMSTANIEVEDKTSKSFVDLANIPETVNRDENEDNPPIDYKVSEAHIERDNNRSNSFNNQDTLFICDAVSSKNIEVENTSSQSLINDAITANSMKVLGNKSNSFIEKSVSVTNIEANHKRSKSFMNDAVSPTNIENVNSEIIDSNSKVTHSGVQSLVNNGASSTDIAPFNIRNNSSLYHETTDTNMKVTQDNVHSCVNKRPASANIEQYKSRSKSFMNDGNTGRNSQAFDIEANSLFNNPMSGSAMEIDNRRTKSFVNRRVLSSNIEQCKTRNNAMFNDAIIANNTEAPRNKSHSFVHNEMFATNMQTDHKKDKSFANNGNTVRTTRAFDIEMSQLMDDTVMESNNEISNNRRHLFDNNVTVVDTVNDSDNDESVLFNSEASEINVETNNYRNNSSVSRRMTARYMNPIDNEFLNDNSNSVKNDAFVVRTIETPDDQKNPFLKDGVVGTNIEVDSSRSTPVVNHGITAIGVNIAQKAGNPFMKLVVSGTNILADKNSRKVLVNDKISVDNNKVRSNEATLHFARGTLSTDMKIIGTKVKLSSRNQKKKVLLKKLTRSRKNRGVPKVGIHNNHS